MSTAAPVRELHLYRRYFELVAAGRKSIEVRVRHPRLADLAAGDVIRFRIKGTDETCDVSVERVTAYGDFEALLDGEGPANVDPTATREEQLVNIRSIYPEEKEALGALAIEMQLLTVAGDGDTRRERRNALIDQIVARRPVPAAVERAMRTVARDQHLPGLDPSRAYADEAVSIKDNPAGPLPLSLASVPSIVAMMLDQLDPRHGDSVLEVGAGTGYNAALLAEIVGPDGQVVTVDIEPDVALHARTALDKTGYTQVEVIERDGLEGAPEHAPYDRMIATVGIWDIPRAWWAQLRDGGRLVLPFRWRGQTRSVSLVRDGDRLVSDGMELCGFVPIIGQDGERCAELADGTIRVHYDRDQGVDRDLLSGVFSGPPAEVWAEARVGGQEPFDGIWLRATVFDDTVCRLEVTEEALDTGVRRPAIPVRSPALVVGESLAYLILRCEDSDPERPYRLGAAGYGPDAPDLACRLVEHIDAWGTDRDAVPTMTVVPAGAALDGLPAGHGIAKKETAVVLSY
ncbi:protein-L-isoaspartate(D-aspartate) O-methyltransferase [Actinacidiphila glaucinigra]|uniref:Protein-L-isoaspartate O-methyltransferase n=2 Tax=Actinacidiphila glaucinigra TaxID=235986 RepID=A0A239INQ2_9ACTN|nr:protein-L-isoaspartate(D-aspartate) O-methyltransferase [Actinacidiphila glaucinigra]